MDTDRTSTWERLPLDVHTLAFSAHLNGHHDAEHDMRRALEQRTASAVATTHRRLDEITDIEQLHALQQDVRAVVLASLGPLRDHRTVTFTRHGVTEARGIRIEPIVYQPREDAHVTATLYTPESVTEPTGAVFIACGHTDESKADPEYQLLARALCREGLVVLVADPIGQGERHSYPAGSQPQVSWGTREHTYAGVQTWWHGFSPARYFAEDALAGLSLLRNLPEVDPLRVGVTGHSGGGALVTLLMAVDDQLAAAAPATFVTSREASVRSGQAQDAEQIVLSGLAHGVDHAQLILSMAPRPVLVLAAAYDFFPLEGTLNTLDRCNSVLTRVGMPEAELEIADEGHAYSPPLRARAVDFFARALALKGQKILADEENPTLAASELTVFPDGVRAAHPDEAFIFERTHADTALLRIRDVERSSTAPLLAARGWLRHAVTVGGDPAPARFPRWFPEIQLVEGIARQGFWLTDRDVHVAGVFIEPRGGADRLRIITGMSTDELTSRSQILEDDGAAVLVLDVRGTGAVRAAGRAPAVGEHIIGAEYKILCDLLILGDTLEAARVRDVLHTVVGAHDGLIPGRRFSTVSLDGRGDRTFTAAVAAAACGTTVALKVDTPPAPGRDAHTRGWDAAAGRWQWMLPGYAVAVGDDLLRRLNDPHIGGEHGDLALLGLVRDALAHPPLPRVGDRNGREQ